MRVETRPTDTYTDPRTFMDQYITGAELAAILREFRKSPNRFVLAGLPFDAEMLVEETLRSTRADP